MTGTLRVLATGVLVAVAIPVHAQAAAAQPSPPGTVEWRSMSGAKVAVPLPATGPMATDLAEKAAPPKWADVPLPPPPGGLKPAPAAQEHAAALGGGAPEGAASAPAVQEAVAPPPAATAAGATAAGLAGVAAATPAATETGAAAPAEGGPGPAKVTSAVDHTGAMISVTQDLDSDRIRMDWAKAGGTLPAFEGNLGMLMLYKDLSKEFGAGAYMNGVGFSAGLRVAILTLDPPDYEKRERSWTAWKIGVGADMGVTSVTINTPTYRALGVTYGGQSTASMSSTTLTGLFGFMHAVGSFDSPSEWSGMAIGLDWAPSQMRTVMTDQYGNSTSSSSFNARAFAINFESGSLQSMASKMGKKAKIKATIFFLPPAGDLPLFINATIGAVWY